MNVSYNPIFVGTGPVIIGLVHIGVTVPRDLNLPVVRIVKVRTCDNRLVHIGVTVPRDLNLPVVRIVKV